MKSFKAEFSEAMSRNPDAKLVEGEELRRLQLLLLEMYLDVQQACEDRGLTCMLLGGSTLGAVRHKGFIPWDDRLRAVQGNFQRQAGRQVHPERAEL